MSKTLSQLPVGSLVVDPNTKYYNSPIVWMVLEHGHDGANTTTLLTEKIICLKAFDAKEPNNSNSDRQNYGNNRWAFSNINQWLNSEKLDWYRNRHSQDQTPNSTYTSQDPYNEEAGFLSNFSYGMKKILKTTGRVTAKNTVTDSGGSETVYSKLFLLSNTEVGVTNENSISEGILYSYFNSNDRRVAYATQECIDNSGTYKPTGTSTAWTWRLRTPITSVTYRNTIINSSGTSSVGNDSGGDHGIRPACVIPNTTTVSDDPDTNGYYTLQLDSVPQTVADLPIGAVVRDPDTKYYGDAINWKIIGKNHDGENTVTLLTEDIVSLKCFDAKESTNPNSNRASYGNNKWSVSNTKQWLNSDASAGNWYSAQHTYDAPPSSANVYQNSGTAVNPYDGEAGFLNGFSSNFKSSLQNASKVTALNTDTDGGGSETVLSKLFLLSNTEVGFSNENGIAEGTIYDVFKDDVSRLAYCNQKCIDNSNYSSDPTTVQGWLWWLRTPYSSHSYDVCFVRDVGSFGNGYGAYGSMFGLRPACVITSTTKVNPTPDSDGVYTLQFNSSPTLTLSSTTLGEIESFPSTFTFTVDDSDNNLSSLTVSLDGTLYSTVDLSQITQGTPTPFTLSSEDFANLTESSHTLVFTATDSEGETATASCTFIKYVPPTSDRLVTHDDAARIISALNAIANRGGKRFNKPTLTSNNIPYDGESHSVTEILEGFNSDFMVLTGDVTVSEEGAYNTFVQFKRGCDEWVDGTANVQQMIWSYGDPYLAISWSNGTDEQIAEMIAASDRGEIDLTDYWEVGDTREVQLSAMSATGVGESHVAQTVELVLVAKDTGVNDSSNPCYNYQYVTATSGRTYPSFIVQQKNVLTNGTSGGEPGYMNSSNTNAGGWNSSARRTWCNNVYKAAVSSSLRGIFKQVKVKTMNNGNQSGAALVESSDYFFLPAEKEIFGSVSYSNSTEANALSIWPYYNDSANRIKYNGSSGSDYTWWERSPYSDGSNAFCRVYGNGSAGGNAANGTNGFAPAGCI